MICTAPIAAMRSRLPNSKGKYPLVFKPQIRDEVGSLLIPCGRCLNCLLERSRQWGMRCVFESKSHERNSFVTLTYEDKYLTYGFVRPTLVPRDLQLFFKRLRREYGEGIKYFACGEYGERTQRPHYHACIFGLDWRETRVPDSQRNGYKYFKDEKLSSIWGMGNVILADFSFETAAYVARYICDKKYGSNAGYYNRNGLEPEFVRMSRRPGIGYKWFTEFKDDVYPNDYVVFDGIEVRPPKYFDRLLELDNELDYEYVKRMRREQAGDKDLNVRELRARDAIKRSQISSLRRDLF